MDNTVLRKKLNTYKSAKGVLKSMSNEVILEVLQVWQNWSGTTADLYRDLELSKGQMSALIRAGKRLVKSGVAIGSEFKEVKVEGAVEPCPEAITLKWDKNKVIRFRQMSQLVEFISIMDKKHAS